MVDYPLESGSGAVTVATVRPETMLADTAIAVNPADERYSRLIGEAAILPLVGRRLPIIADDYVDPEFGTGALKITPGHDPSDFEIGRRHGLDEVTVIGEDGRITDAAPAAVPRHGGRRGAGARSSPRCARRGSSPGTQPYEHDVPHSHRSGRRIEPLISLQWFCDMDRSWPRPAIAAVQRRPPALPPRAPWTEVYLDWLENIRPWCISRQLWWGHQLPVWYRGEETYVGEKPPEGDGWERDPDVLDTWFSSGLWPFATLGWPERDAAAARLLSHRCALHGAGHHLPLGRADGHVRGRAHRRAALHRRAHPLGDPGAGRPAHVQVARHGHRPVELIEGGPRPPVFEEGGEFPAYGADALRFGLLAMSSAQDVRFNEERVRQGRDLANKLWNASRLILLRRGGVEPDPRAGPRRSRTAGSCRGSSGSPSARPAARRLPLLGRRPRALRRLLVGAVRLVPRAGQAAPLRARTTPRSRPCCCTRSSATLRLLHPVMPFVTEEIWSLMPGERGLLAVADWPEADPARFDDERGGRESAPDRGRDRPAALPRPGGRQAGRPLRGAPGGRGLRRTARRSSPGWRASSWSTRRNGDAAGRPCPCPGGVVQVLPSDAFDADEAPPPHEKEREQLGRRSSGRAQAGQREASWKAPRRGGGGGAPQARRAPRGAAAASRSVTFRAGRGVPARASSCSACASGSTACTG